MADKLDRIFKALSDPTRRRIFNMLVLATVATNITTIADRFHLTRQAITKHISILERAGLVKAERKGREALFVPKPEALASVRQWLSVYDEFWSEKLDALGAHLAKRAKTNT